MKQDIIEENTAKLAKVLDIYSKYLGGEIFTLADLHHLPILYYLTSCQELHIFQDRPHVNAWRKDSCLGLLEKWFLIWMRALRNK